MMIKEKFKKIFSNDTAILILIVVLIIGGVFISRIFILPVTVSGHSMDTTLDNNMYGWSSVVKDGTEIERGDIVIVKTGEKILIKRVIALPNETISCKNGVVYINDKALEEDYITGITSDFDEVALSENEYFVMGDNREHSKDSREIGAITHEQILAKHLFVITSLTKFGYHK